MIKKYIIYTLIFIFILSVTGCGSDNYDEAVEKLTKLLYQGHASLKITAADGTVIYVDPSAGEGYDVPADIILVTHEHADHNLIELVPQKDDCVIIRAADALINGIYNNFLIKDVSIETVQAHNANHSIEKSVGYIITVNDIIIYVAGDTSKTEQMETLSIKEIDYAFLPCDGIYNMGIKEAAKCFEIIGARFNIPYHTKNKNTLLDMMVVEKVEALDKLIIEPGEEIILVAP